MSSKIDDLLSSKLILNSFNAFTNYEKRGLRRNNFVFDLIVNK